MISSDLALTYPRASVLQAQNGMQQLVLAHQSELAADNQIPCFFWGRLTDPFLSAKCLLTLSKVVRTSFCPIPPVFRDPIVSAGSDQIRFEGFSSCNGVYARLDVLEDAIDGEFIASGTTNVDFNEPMLHALNAVKKGEELIFGVGSKELSIQTSNHKVVEKKVSLPARWIKGLSSVQLFMADMEPRFTLNKMEVISLFQGLPKGASKGSFYLSKRGKRYMWSPLPGKDGVHFGGIARLRLLEGLIMYCDRLQVYQSREGTAVAVLADFGHMRFTLALSPDNYRGFSGEGNVLEHMVQEVPTEWIHGMHALLNSNEQFNPTLLSIEHDVPFQTMDTLTASLASIGLLGYDLQQGKHYYRRLPFKMERILSLNPRLKHARQLLDRQGVQFIKRAADQVEARVEGSGVQHTVLIREGKAQCTCNWFTKHADKRGLCKHILAVKMQLEV